MIPFIDMLIIYLAGVLTGLVVSAGIVKRG